MAEHKPEGALRIGIPTVGLVHFASLVAQNRACIPRDAGLEKPGAAFGNSLAGRHEI
jgi:hypothetical protein